MEAVPYKFKLSLEGNASSFPLKKEWTTTTVGSTELDGMVLDGAVLGGVVWYDMMLDGMV